MDEQIVAGRPGSRARVGRIIGVVATLVATALAVGLAQGWGRTDRAPEAPPAAGPPAAAPPAAPVTTASVLLNSTDDAFIQLLIPMNEGALALIDQFETRPADADPSLRALLADVRVAHQAELRDLRGLLAAGNVAELNIHEGHQMPGMVTDTSLAELRAAPDAEVSSRAAALLRAHLAQTVVLCRGEQNAGGSPELKALAGRIQQARAAELSTLDGRPGATTAAPVN
ncbi:DUF305 domain-containing protein [Micromonospora parathelypteridis]|uniref:Uncharacterized protein (DUF305 family) n=1 Tax=Micromonospora parathelypteridis TaxID=1839617 RepID=A0A840VP44_9ACTN|nr:DUF305 domain-containing protein [Micromonospora parathelypteridis]MBB5478873.1 uncharacterized protein (DUF305 family) [Micromonospora parathelypteridis]GGO04175.1 hypothetical protein GCM10011576_05310 [Micromonospora parathelypteridis]